MVHMYLQLIVVFSSNVALDDIVFVERVELSFAAVQLVLAEVSLLWIWPSIDRWSTFRHCLADDLQELSGCPVPSGIMCAEAIDTELVPVVLKKTLVVIQIPES